MPSVFLTLDVLLDGADIRQALGRSVKLNLPLMFRCLCHLLLAEPDKEITPRGSDTEVRKALFSRNLRRLLADGVARAQPDDEASLDLH